MTRQRDLDLILGAFFVEGTNEVADRVIDAALDEIDTTSQRRRPAALRRFTTMSLPIRLAAAAVIGVLAVSGVLLLWRPFSTNVGVPPATASPPVSAAPSLTSGSTNPPTSAAWAATGALPGDYQRLSAVPLDDGRVLALGGGDPTGQIFDPRTGAWTAAGAMGHPRSLPAAAKVSDGRVLVVGSNEEGANTGELFDPAGATWSSAGEPRLPRIQPTSITMPDHRVLIVGGDGGGLQPLQPSAEVYDGSRATWTLTAPMQVGRANPGLAVLGDGRILAMGGFAGERGTSQGMTCEIYDPATNTWTATGDMHAARVFGSSILLQDGRVLSVGGEGQLTGDIYDPATGTWTATKAIAALPGNYYVPVLLPDGSVYLTGGGGKGARLDPATGIWTSVASGPAAAFVRSATPLRDGNVLIVEGLTADGGASGSAPAELFDPAKLP